jgi:hypothetical protein
VSYSEKRYAIKGGGSQIYIEYAVIPEEFHLKVDGRVIDMNDVGKGVGTFEDAYGSPV